MLKKIWILVKEGHYGVKSHFSIKLSEALQRHGITTEVIKFKKDKEYGGLYKKQPPDLFCSFNTIYPHELSRISYKAASIPILAMFTDSLFPILSIIKNCYALTTCNDRKSYSLLKQNDYENVIFLPTAVEKDLSYEKYQPREYDVVFIGSCYNHQDLRESWHQQYSQQIAKLIDLSIEIALRDLSLAIWEALYQAMDSLKIHLDRINMVKLYLLIQTYINGLDRFELIRAIDKAEVHIFGGVGGKKNIANKGWSHYFNNVRNIHVHPEVSFENALEIMKRSKICLNSMLFRNDSSHERLLSGYACGSLVISTDNIWAKENFQEDKEIVFYRYNQWYAVNEKIDYYLTHEDARQAVVDVARNNIMDHHTWDHRVETLLDVLPSMIENWKKKGNSGFLERL